MRLKFNLLLCLLSICNFMHSQQFASGMYGYRIPVYNWDGKGNVLDYTIEKLDSNLFSPVLVILGRSSSAVWYVSATCDNDAADFCWNVLLVRLDTNGKSFTCAPNQLKSQDTTFKQQFRRWYSAAFTKYHLQNLKTVDVWMSPWTATYTAKVNCKPLNRCFTWSFDIFDDPNDGTCAFYLSWDAGSDAYETEREVGVYDQVLTIPSGWSYLERSDSTGFISDGTDTLYFHLCSESMRLHEKTEEDYYDDIDSSWTDNYNIEARRYNDSLRKQYPLVKTDSIYSHREGYGQYVYFVPKVRGKLIVIAYQVGYKTADYIFETTVMDHAKAVQFSKIIEQRYARQ